MGLYVEVRKSEDGNVITNATFSPYAFSNLGSGLYFVFAPANANFWISATGRTSLLAYSDSYYYLYAWLAKAPPPHSSSHSHSGW